MRGNLEFIVSSCFTRFCPFVHEMQARIWSSHPPCDGHRVVTSRGVNSRRNTTEYKRRLAKIRRRRQALFQSANRFHELFDAEAYVVLHRNGQFYVYSSGPSPRTQNWPSTYGEIMSSVAPPIFILFAFCCLQICLFCAR